LYFNALVEVMQIFIVGNIHHEEHEERKGRKKKKEYG
jgi:hypothetical protein